MIWRSAVVAGYVALAVVVGVAFGAHGLEVLFFYYSWALAWLAFALVWGRVARAGGRWNVERLESAPEDDYRSDRGRGHTEPDAAERPEFSLQTRPDPSAPKRPQPVPST